MKKSTPPRIRNKCKRVKEEKFSSIEGKSENTVGKENLEKERKMLEDYRKVVKSNSKRIFKTFRKELDSEEELGIKKKFIKEAYKNKKTTVKAQNEHYGLILIMLKELKNC